MAKQKKMTTAQKTVAKMEREHEFARQQRGDALGITGENARKYFNYKNLIRAKLVLLILLPIAFFVYSPLLLPLCLLYASTFFIARNFEKKANKGLRKHLWISIPRFDGLIAIILICIVMFGVLISVATTSAKPSEFAGKNQKEIQQILIEKGVTPSTAKKAAQAIADHGFTLSRGQQYSLQLTTMFTGERVFFMARNGAVFGFAGDSGAEMQQTQGSGNGGGTLKIKGEDGNVTTVDLGTKAGISDIPFVNTLSAVIVVLNIIILVGVFSGGIYTIRKMKQLKTE